VESYSFRVRRWQTPNLIDKIANQKHGFGMRRWFLSYHSPDEALAERLKAGLERKDRDSRVFFAP
jgi:hypothetical protein